MNNISKHKAELRIHTLKDSKGPKNFLKNYGSSTGILKSSSRLMDSIGAPNGPRRMPSAGIRLKINYESTNQEAIYVEAYMYLSHNP